VGCEASGFAHSDVEANYPMKQNYSQGCHIVPCWFYALSLKSPMICDVFRYCLVLVRVFSEQVLAAAVLKAPVLLLKHGIVGSSPSRGIDVFPRISVFCCPV
jgi:hypothetical protein